MTEGLVAVGALIVFCLLTFGAAGLVAAWMGSSPGWLRRASRRSRPHRSER